LRYDLTAPLARYVAENFDHLPKPYRSYREGLVFRNEKPGPGRFRQFMQLDADTVGSASMAADAEICMMAADTMEALGLGGKYVVKVNNRKVLDGVMESIGLADEAHTPNRLIVLRAIDKWDRLGEEGVRLLLGSGRKDESGDFTKGAGLDPEQISLLIEFVRAQHFIPLEDISGAEGKEHSARGAAMEFTHMDDSKAGTFRINNDVTIANLRKKFALNATAKAGIEELQHISDFASHAGYSEDQIRIDPSVVRGLEYYTGPVYEVELTFETRDEHGRPLRFGSVGGGGRYDGLVGRFRSEAVPATGFSIGVSRLQAALAHLRQDEARPEPGPVVVTVLDQDRMTDYLRMATALRDAGIAAEVYLGSGRFGAQMKYADRRRSPCVVIQGSDEKAKGEVQIKDLILGVEIAGLSKDRDDYLKKQAEAQFAAPEAALVEAVRRVLARHDMRSA
jgi:histidyl-tRNA synthetase